MVFPSTFRDLAAPWLQRVPRNGSPPSRLLRAAPTSDRPSLPASFRPRVPPCARLFGSPWKVGTPFRKRGCLGCGFPNHYADGGNDRISQVPGGPPVHMPCSQTPAETHWSGHYDPWVLPSGLTARRTTSASASWTYRGSITRPMHSLSTLRSAGRPVPRKTRFWLLASFARWGWIPTGSHCKVSGCLCHPSSSPRLGLAHSPRSSARSPRSPRLIGFKGVSAHKLRAPTHP